MNTNECDGGECTDDPKYTDPYEVPALPKNEDDGGEDGGGADLSNYYTKAQTDAKISTAVDGISVPKVPASMVYDFVSPTGDNNPSTAENANITARVVNTTTGAVTNTTLMIPMATSTQAGSITAAEKTKLINLEDNGDVLIGEGVTVSEDAGTSVAIGAYAHSGRGQSVVIGNGAHGGANSRGIAIGNMAHIYNQTGAIAIGSSSSTQSLGTVSAPSIAIGEETNARGSSVALGAQSRTSTTRNYEVSIGRGSTPGVKTRFLANVTAGELDTDAVNMSQLNAALARIEALETEVAALKGEQTS